MSSFNPEQHLISSNSKITASLARISEVFRVLTQAQAQDHGLSSTQLQLLLFMQFHPDPQQRKAAFMAKEFNVTKATISDSVKALEQKGLVQRLTDEKDSRSFILSLTAKGQELAMATQNVTAPLDEAVNELLPEQRVHLQYALFDLIYLLNQAGIVSPQRMCYRCHYYGGNRKDQHFCNLLNVPLLADELRLECPEFTKPR